MKRLLAGLLLGWLGAKLVHAVVIVDRRLQAEAEAEIMARVGKFLADQLEATRDAQYGTFVELGRRPTKRKP